MMNEPTLDKLEQLHLDGMAEHDPASFVIDDYTQMGPWIQRLRNGHGLATWAGRSGSSYSARSTQLGALLLASHPRMMKTKNMGNVSMATPKEPRPRDFRAIGYIALALVAAASMYGLKRLRGSRAPCSTPTTSVLTEPATDAECSCDPDRVAGNLIMLDDNGAWSWFQDERVIHDAEGRKLVLSSVASYLGQGGERRDADIDVTTFELATGRRTRAVLSNMPTSGLGDDHNAAALWQRPDGRYLAMYTGHLWRSDEGPKSFYRVTTNPHDASTWGPEASFVWPSNDTTEPINDDVTYSNLLYLARENRLYNIARAADRTPGIMVSDDWGEHWCYAGKLSVTDEQGQQGQYSNGYFKLSSNGVDRFDFIATEHHPRNFNTSVYHGYVHADRSYAGCGELVDGSIFDELASEPARFTPVWVTSEVTPKSHHHGWTAELERDDDDGSLHALLTTRHGTSIAAELPGDCDHRLFYGRFDGSRWHTTEIAKMGGPLYPSEQDYTGLGAIHPNDPSTIYISTPFDPRSGSKTDQHEIYKGVSHDDGASWTWTAITWNSTVDNLRPIIPSWDAHHTAVLWLRGSYLSQRSYDLSVVGIVDRSSDESTTRITYVDANASNTTLADGSKLTTTVGTSRGAADDRWHERRGVGNAGNIFASNELDDEDAPALMTTLAGLTVGTYDVFVLHWANPDEDWRIQAGFSASELLVLRQKASQLAVPSDLEDGSDVLTVGDTVRMYRSYVGRVDVTDGGAIQVVVDDVGGGTLERTWYDGLGYSRVSSSTDPKKAGHHHSGSAWLADGRVGAAI
jgi:hypothetical protein